MLQRSGKKERRKANGRTRKEQLRFPWSTDNINALIDEVVVMSTDQANGAIFEMLQKLSSQMTEFKIESSARFEKLQTRHQRAIVVQSDVQDTCGSTTATIDANQALSGAPHPFSRTYPSGAPRRYGGAVWQ